MGSWCWKRFTECIRPTKMQEKVPGRSLPSTWPKGDVFDLIKLLKNTDFTIFLHLVYTPNIWLLHKHRQVYWQLATPLEVFIIHHRPWRDHLREGNFGQHYKCIVKGRHAALWTWQGKSYSGYWTHHPDVLEDDPVLYINLWTNWRLTYGFSFDLCPVPSLKKFGTEPTIPPFQPWTFLPAFVRGQQTCLADPSWNYEISFTNFLILRQPHYFRNPTKSFWTFASSSSPSPFATALHATSTMSWYQFFSASPLAVQLSGFLSRLFLVAKCAHPDSERTPCFRGHDEAGLLAFEALQGLPRPARETEDKARLTGTRIYILWGYAHASPQNCLLWGPGFGTSFCSNLAAASCYLHGGRFWRQQVPSPLWWRNLLQVLARELNHFKQQRKALRQASQLCCFGLQMQFVTVFWCWPSWDHRGEQDRTEIGSKAPPAVAKSTPTAAKLGCAFSHSAERIVDELGLLYPENRGNLRKNMASV